MAGKVVVIILCCVELLMVKPFKIGHLVTEFFNYASQNNEDFGEGDVSVQFADPNQVWFSPNQEYTAFCGKDAVKVVLPSGPLSELKVLGSTILDPALEEAKECDYSLSKEQGNNVLWVSFSGCPVTVEEGRYTLRLLHRNNLGPAEVVTASCDVDSDVALQKLRVPRSDGEANCTMAPVSNMAPNKKLPQKYVRGGCDIPTTQRLACGPSEMTASECINKGCCMAVNDSFCYYPMDHCTADGQFVFTVYSNVTTIPVNPTRLMVANKVKPCKPVYATEEFATFKFSLTDCGAKSYNIGDTTIYMAEVRTAIRVLNLKYGAITRDHPVRLMVECRYSEISQTMMRATVGYMVVSPSVPASVSSEGLYGVQLRLAEDETFASFFTHSRLPLNQLLGRPLYLELLLNSPKPEATLLVNYCVAYTRSARNALVLLYEGCPDPVLTTAHTSFLRVLDLPQTPYRRRFVVTAFQFMNVSTQKYINEEIYFMCSTEVCMPSETPCPQTCFDGKA